MKNLLFGISLLLLLSTCKKEQSSSENKILNYSISNLSQESLTLDAISLDESNRTISLLFADRILPDKLPLSFTPSFELSAGATSTPAAGEKITMISLDEPVKYIVTAENGDQIEYSIILRDNQLPNNGFEDWYSTSGMNGAMYNECGKSAETTVWATANYGTSMYGLYGTIPLADGENTLVRISTGETSMIPLTAGTLFTGKFDINVAIANPTDPTKATKFGIPFSLRPSAIRFKYSFQPGSRYLKATPNNPTSIFGGFTVTDIEGEDMFTVYSILEKRNGTDVIEIGRAEIISGDVQSALKEITIPYNYTSNEKPSHISVIFSSSKDGDLFTGAVGSTLTIDDIELVY